MQAVRSFPEPVRWQARRASSLALRRDGIPSSSVCCIARIRAVRLGWRRRAWTVTSVAIGVIALCGNTAGSAAAAGTSSAGFPHEAAEAGRWSVLLALAALLILLPVIVMIVG